MPCAYGRPRGVDAAGAVWFAMRRVRGRTIAKRYSTRKLLEAWQLRQMVPHDADA